MSYLYEARQQQPNPPESNGMQSQQHPDMAQLPPTREAVVEQGLRIQQETAAERDALRRELAQRDSDIAAYKVALEAQSAQLTQAAAPSLLSMPARSISNASPNR